MNLDRAESFGFLGFDFRRLRMERQVWRGHYTPKLKKRTALLRKLKDVFRRYHSQPVDRVVQLINPVLRGWVNYFAVGHSSELLQLHQRLGRKEDPASHGAIRNRRGFGWKRWSRRRLYGTPSMIGLITLGMKETGKRSAGKPHAAFDVAGTGNVTMAAGLRSIAKVMESPPAPTVARLFPTLLKGDSMASGQPC